MSRDWTKIWMAALIVAFCAEHIYLEVRAEFHSPLTIDGPTCVIKMVKP